jgi:hypothetical protein
MNGTIRRRPVTTISSTSSSTSIKQNDDYDDDDDGDDGVNGRGDDDDGDTLHRRPRRRKINSSISRLTNQLSSVAAAKRKKDGSLWSRLRYVDIALFVSITIKLLSFVYYRSNKQRQQTTMTRNDNNHRQPFQLHSSSSSSSSSATTTATNINTTQLFPKWVHRWMMGHKMTFHSPLLYNRGNENEDVSLYSSLFDNDANDDDESVILIDIDDEQLSESNKRSSEDNKVIKNDRIKGMFLRDEHFDSHKEQLTTNGYVIVDDVIYTGNDNAIHTQLALVTSVHDIRVAAAAAALNTNRYSITNTKTDDDLEAIKLEDTTPFIINESHSAFDYWDDDNNDHDDHDYSYYYVDEDGNIVEYGRKSSHNNNGIITDDDAFDHYYAFDDDIQRGTHGMGFDTKDDPTIDDKSSSSSTNWRKTSNINHNSDHQQQQQRGICTQPEYYRQYQPTCNELHSSISGYHWLIGEDIYSRRWRKKQAQSQQQSTRLLRSKYLSHGFYRDAFLFRQSYVTLSPLPHSSIKTSNEDVSTTLLYDEVVFKTMQTMNIETNDKYSTMHQMEDMRKDAMVMELLSSSPRVIDIYSHCAMSAVTEFAPTDIDKSIMPTTGYSPKSIHLRRRGGKQMSNDNNTGALVPEERLSLNDNIFSPKEKLKMALEMAKCIAVLHGHKDGPIVHVDIKSDQFFRGRDGYIKIIDYNRAEALLYDTANDMYCKWTNGQPTNGQFRSPEEAIDAGLTEKIDVYSFGNVLYSLLTGKMVWENEGVDIVEMHQRIINGYTVPIPKHFDTNPLVGIIRACWTYNPDKRPSIFDVVHTLEEALRGFDKYTEKEELG